MVTNYFPNRCPTCGADDAAHVAKLEANLDSAIAGQRIALERLQTAERLAADRLDGLLAAAAFTTILAKQLRLEQQGET